MQTPLVADQHATFRPFHLADRTAGNGGSIANRHFEQLPAFEFLHQVEAVGGDETLDFPAC